MSPPKITLTSELTIEEQVMIKLEVFEERFNNLTKHIDELTQEIKELKRIQVDRLENHEKRISILEEKLSRHVWIINILTGVLITGIAGALLSLVLKG